MAWSSEEVLVVNTGLDQHLTEKTLEEWAFNRLPACQSAPVEEHLLVCPTCQDRLAEIDEYIIVMKTALMPPSMGAVSKHSAA